MSLYAVVDTNVLLSALLSKKKDTATVKVLQAMMKGHFTPLWHEEIMEEYNDVFHREKFHLKEENIQQVFQTIKTYGKYVPLLKEIATDEHFIDTDDIIFWQVMMSERKNGAFLITGNIKHFPNRNFIVTPAQMIEIFNW